MIRSIRERLGGRAPKGTPLLKAVFQCGFLDYLLEVLPCSVAALVEKLLRAFRVEVEYRFLDDVFDSLCPSLDFHDRVHRVQVSSQARSVASKTPRDISYDDLISGGFHLPITK